MKAKLLKQFRANITLTYVPEYKIKGIVFKNESWTLTIYSSNISVDSRKTYYDIDSALQVYHRAMNMNILTYKEKLFKKYKKKFKETLIP